MYQININKLTHGNNMRWESSRIILPIHRERINQHRKELLKREKLILDEQQVTEFAQIIAE
ncbi:hypothetical protein BFG57_06835 [Bacillus solimangrovi]|uniref:YolD-like family protein n=1 Tax=Bacillus solimangrovi TaxID=1305675 RepID=A0A1E5LAE7_9BACI|nr:hypothetical protein BFG57_06835 [Bacillus solimangrovi]